ncbi:hypothetical protein [Amycolatopsis rubida]|nr:hypothetical protein [Amycolatopsis rubida]
MTATAKDPLVLEPAADRFLKENAIRLHRRLVDRKEFDRKEFDRGIVCETWAMILERGTGIGDQGQLAWLCSEARIGGRFRWDQALYGFARSAWFGTLSYDEYVARNIGPSPEVVLDPATYEDWAECVCKYHKARKFLDWNPMLLGQFSRIGWHREFGPPEKPCGDLLPERAP